MKDGYIKSLLCPDSPPVPGQPQGAVEWSWLDLYREGDKIRSVVRDTPPTQEEIEQVIKQLHPHFLGSEEKPE